MRPRHRLHLYWPLTANGGAVNGNHEFIFSVYDVAAGGAPVAGPLPAIPAAVTNGLFTVVVDFVAGTFTGPPRFLAISVRPVGGGAFQLLTPRQELTSSPYAIRAASAGTATDVANGAVVKSLNTLRDNVTLAAGSNVTITPSGNTLTLASAGAGGNGIWSAFNNNAFYLAGNVGIGTITPAHRLSLIGGPSWTTHGWVGSLELPNAAALGWQANAAGQRFGMGHTSTGFFLFRTASNPGNAASPPTYDFCVDDSGNVGIGTITPTAGVRLEVNGPTRVTAGGSGGYLQIAAPNGETGLSAIGVNRFDLRFDGVTLKLGAGPGTGPTLPANGITMNTNGNVGIGMANPLIASQWKLEVSGPTRLSAGGSGGAVQFSAPNGESGMGILGANRADFRFDGSTLKLVAGTGNSPPPSGNGIAVHTSGNVGIGTGTDAPLAKLDVRGTTRTCVLTITGGCDLAEPFPMNGSDAPKGSVVVIDDENPGRVKLSDRAYDTRVAGIVSGANGINPGISLQQEGVLDGGQNVALSGRVYVQADAVYGAIKPGDLLTTSGTPGHAMKVSDHTKAQGAILGKAMSALKADKGMVLVLVTLQ